MATLLGRMPGVGDLAPEFSLPGTPDGETLSLASFRGKQQVLLVFYIFDFSPG